MERFPGSLPPRRKLVALLSVTPKHSRWSIPAGLPVPSSQSSGSTYRFQVQRLPRSRGLWRGSEDITIISKCPLPCFEEFSLFSAWQAGQIKRTLNPGAPGGIKGCCKMGSHQTPHPLSGVAYVSASQCSPNFTTLRVREKAEWEPELGDPGT